MKKTVFLTGGSGRIGKRVLKALLNRGYRVKFLVHRHEPELRANDYIEIVRGDILNPEGFSGALKGCQIVCHLAAVFDMFGSPKFEKDNDLLFDNIVRGTYNLLEAAIKAGGIELFLYASTDAVFSAIYKEYKTPVTEEVEVFPRPGRFYAVAKVLAEDLCIYYQKSFSLPYTIIRIGWSLSEDELLEIFSYEFWEGLIDSKKREALRSKLAGGKGVLAPLFQNGESLSVHLADSDDTAMGFVLAIENIDRARNNIFNIAGYAPFSYRDVIEKVAHGLGVPWMSVKLNDPEKYEISNEKARKILGYKPRYNIDIMIEKALKKRKTAP